MNTINATELKTQSILAIMAALENEQEVAIKEAKADIAARRYVIETADEHNNRIDKMMSEYALQTENA